MKKLMLALASAMSLASVAHAGPFIIDGTDADDHGSASGGSNQDGWLYIQKALENIGTGAGLTRTQKTIAVLGSDAGTKASSAAQSGCRAIFDSFRRRLECRSAQRRPDHHFLQ